MQMRRKGCQAGFSMFEVLLGLLVVAVATVLIVRMQKSANDDLRAKALADSLQVFSQGALRYLDTPGTNRTALVAAMRNGTGAATWCGVWNGTAYDAINDTALHTCAVDVRWLKNKNILPATVPNTNNYGQTWVAIYRLTNAADLTSEDVEMLVVASGGSAVDANQYGLAAQLLGGIGGYVPATAVCGADVCGTGGWTASLASFGAVKQ